MQQPNLIVATPEQVAEFVALAMQPILAALQAQNNALHAEIARLQPLAVLYEKKYSAAEAANFLGVSPSKLGSLVKDGTLKLYLSDPQKYTESDLLTAKTLSNFVTGNDNQGINDRL
jgi:hypothetical protein